MPSAIEGKGNSILNVVLYSIVYLAYGCMRISRQLEKKKKKSPVKLVRILFLAAFAGIIAAMIIPAVQRAQASSEAEILSEGSGSNNTDMSEDQSTDENQTQDENEPEDENNPDGHANGTNSTEQTNAEERIVSAVKEGDKALDIVYQDGKYTGSGTGYNGRLTVAVVIEGGKIADVYLKGSVDDEPYLTDAADGIFPAVIESGTAEVDAVSNATTTSHALIDAIRDALEKAQ